MTVPETVTGAFVLVPERGADPVRTPREGTVAEVRVSEGQTVAKGATLFVIRSQAVGDRMADMRGVEMQGSGVQARLTNAQAEYESQRRADELESRRLTTRVASLERIAALKKKQLGVTRDMAERSKRGQQSGAVGGWESDRLGLEVDQLEGEVETIAADKDEARAALAKLRQDAATREVQHRELVRSLQQEGEIARVRVESMKRQPAGAGGDLVVTAPCTGALLRMMVSTPGAVVQAGDPLGEIAVRGRAPSGGDDARTAGRGARPRWTGREAVVRRISLSALRDEGRTRALGGSGDDRTHSGDDRRWTGKYFPRPDRRRRQHDQGSGRSSAAARWHARRGARRHRTPLVDQLCVRAHSGAQGKLLGVAEYPARASSAEGVGEHQLTCHAASLMMQSSYTLDQFTTEDDAMRRCLELARVAARTDIPVLILGESGTGKTMLARAVHMSSSRAKGAFASFNAAALSDTLLDSQLFGHEKGAFTGATKRVLGKFEQAHGGTLFIDEIADMTPRRRRRFCAPSSTASSSGSAPKRCRSPTCD